MAAPTKDGSFASNVAWSTSSSATVTLTTTGTTGLVVVTAGYEVQSGTLPTISSVTATGLTFTLRKRQQNTASTIKTGIEVWEAPYTAKQTSKIITVTASGTIDDGVIGAMGVAGLHSSSTPLDSNGSMPNGQSASPINSVSFGYSTTQANDLLLAVFGSAEASVPSAPTGWTSQLQSENAGGVGAYSVSFNTKAVTTVQTSQSVTCNGLGGGEGAGIVLAYTADAPSTTETGTAEMDHTGFSFVSSGGNPQEVGTASVHFVGIGMVATGTDTESDLAKLREFWTR